MDEQKICFITCVNDETYYEESLLYLRNLQLPTGMQMQFLAVRGAASMASGYNEAMRQSNAKYKVYLHQDAFLLKKDYIKIICELFQKEKTIGLIGLAGCRKISGRGIWWKEKELYGQICHAYEPESLRKTYYGKVIENHNEVQAVDGVIMATQYDIPWREDVFYGWHFYDISQSMEFQRYGYKVIVPQQKDFWLVHATKDKSLGDAYQQFRESFLAEYGKEIAL